MARKKNLTPEEKKKKKKLIRIVTAVATGGASEVTRAGIFAPILPFKPLMLKQLKAHGVELTSKKDKKLENVAKLFYEKVVKPRHIEENGEEHIAPVIASVLSGIVKFIKDLSAKKKAGEPMSKNEEKIANEVVKIDDEVTKTIKGMAKEEAQQSLGEKILSPVGITISIVVIIIVIVLITKFTGKK